MKPFRTLLLAAFAVLVCAATASAQTTVRITGSTAYRGAVHTAITHILASGFTYGYVGGTLSGASQAIFTGTVGGNSVIIKTSWSGSLGGVQTVSRNLNVSFLPNSTAQSTGGTANATAGTEAGVPDVALSDGYQSSTPFASPVLTDTLVGIVPFKWVASPGAPAGLADVTPQLAQALFGNGSMSLALFTGLHADQSAQVFAIGRDPDSGTRLTAFAETGVGVNSQVVQYQPTISGGAVTSQIPWPVTIVNGITYPQGDAGFSSGGSLATAMTATTFANLGGYYVTYLSTSDAQTAITGGAKELTYNGVAYSPTAVAEGQYTFWGYEHLLYRTSLTGVFKSTADALANQILNVDATVLINTMQVTRPTDGGLVTQNY